MVIAGEAGTGKSMACFGFEEPIEMWDMESKNKDLQDTYFSDKIIIRKDLLAFDDSFREDYYQTYLNLKTEIDKIIAHGKLVRSGKSKSLDIETLVIDGISFIRNKCMFEKWLHDHPKRKQPNEYEWGDINTDVRDLLFPLINMSVMGLIPNLIFTAEFKDTYEVVEVFDERTNKIVKKSVKSGREPAYSDYLGYKLYTLLELYTDVKTKKYKVICTKSLKGIWESDVTGKSVYDVLLERGL